MKKTKIIESPLELIQYRNEFSYKSTHKRSIGFVPTMGALHAGHASLMKEASHNHDLSIVSIFVNPTQFNNSTDLEKYPKTFGADLALAQECNIDVLFYPKYADIYPDQYRFKMSENEFSQKLCGAYRPGHFDGVLTVVLKLLNITAATKAYFGLKDYQQYKLIDDMTKSFFLDVEIIGCPTVRESSGLAMSSRNLRLSPQAFEKASLIYKTITQKINANEAKNILNQNGFEVDYLEDIENRRYVAATLEGVRLIDNVNI